MLKEQQSSDDIVQFPQRVTDRTTIDINELSRKMQQIQRDLRSKWFKEAIEKSAKEHLLAHTYPSFSTSESESAKNEAIFIEMASQLRSLGDAEEINDGSGGVYLISDETGAPRFVFKPFDESPGTPGNKKGQTPESLQVFAHRSLDPKRLAFPIDQGMPREYSLPVLLPGLKPRRALATLRLSSESDVSQSGLLMEYVPHLFNLDAVKDELLAGVYEVQLQENERKLSELKPDAELIVNIQKLMNERNGIEAKKKDLKIKTNKSKAQLELLARYKDRLYDGKLSTLPLWDDVVPDSLHNLVHYSLFIPDFDRNAQNILVQETSGKYELVLIDGDQIFPDSWQIANSPAWQGCKACDFVLKDTPLLLKSIPQFDARAVLDGLKRRGVHFQETAKQILDPNTEKMVTFGGDVFSILNAFHSVAKIGLINGNTANEVADILFEYRVPGKHPVKDLFFKAKKIQGKHVSDAWTKLKEDGLYKQCFESITYENKDDAIFWENFYALVLEEFIKNKTRRKSQ